MIDLIVWRVDNSTQLVQDVIEDVCSPKELFLGELTLCCEVLVGGASASRKLSYTDVVPPHTSEDIFTGVVLEHDKDVLDKIKLRFVGEHHASARVHDALPYFV